MFGIIRVFDLNGQNEMVRIAPDKGVTLVGWHDRDWETTTNLPETQEKGRR